MNTVINTDETPIIYEGIKYYPTKNSDLSEVEYLTINYENRKIIYSVDCLKHNNNHIICLGLTNNKIINNIEVDGIYIKVNKIIKLTLKFITYDATFKNKNYCEPFDDTNEIYRNDFNEYS
jgi:hypothetical protein